MTVAPDFEKRRDRLRKLVGNLRADALLVTSFTNVTYLTGFTGDDSYLVVSKTGDLLISDPRYEQQISEQCPQVPAFIRRPDQQLLDVTGDQIRDSKLTSLLVEGETMSIAAFEQLKSSLNATQLGISHGQVESLRMIKDTSEIALLRTAVEIAQRVFSIVRAQMRPGQTERQVADEIDHQVRLLGGSGCSFRPIVAVGPRAALPHASPGQSQICSSPFVLIDWGALFSGYRSDLTRVLLTSKIPPKFSKAYETVLAAQKAAIASIRPGVMTSEIDAIARAVMQDAGMGRRFNHGLGHGIGLDIHEAPRLGKSQNRPLEAGMVVTVEPGAYFPGWGGIRIEDDILVTRDGCEVLSDLPREIEDIQIDLLP